jgi:two-component system chemotaxis response regulator CheB
VYGPEAAFVVLSGRGVDGSDSIPLAKKRGATVVAQNQSTAEYFGMPGAAIATGQVDAVLPLSAIGPYLVRWVNRPALDDRGLEVHDDGGR